ncbi:MAG: dihydrofolate synthase, partial [Actinobacteria bacterium]|nr:dihydrofolate synthase [Actinomycetota bacterium]
GIFKPESNVVLSAQTPEVAKVLLAKAAKVSANVFREGVEFSVKNRSLAVGGQVISLHGMLADIDEIYLPLYGIHQANNAAVALAAVEAFTQVKLDEDLIRSGFSKVKSPGRCEIVYTDPLVIIDAAHNPHGVAAIAQTINSEFDLELVIAVVAVLADKDADGILAGLVNSVDYLVITQSNSPRALSADQLSKVASRHFKADQIEVISDLTAALTFAIEKATLANQINEGVAAVLVTGSVATAGAARGIIRKLGGRRL